MRNSGSCFLAVACLAMLMRTAAASETVSVTVRGTYLVPSVRSLAPICPTAVRIRACTTFSNEQLSTHCTKSGDTWRLGAIATVDASVYLWNPRMLRHEQLHIDDVRASMEQYLTSVNRIAFPSRENCEVFAEHSRSIFPEQLNVMKLRSNEKRDRFANQARSH